MDKRYERQIIKEGYTVIDNIIDKVYIESVFEEINNKYIKNNSFKKGLLVGDKRYMLNIELDLNIIDERIFASKELINIIYNLLGKRAIIESFGVVFSLPGAKKQQLHRDGNILFDEVSVKGNASIAGLIPPYALTLGIPLIDMNEETGTTQIEARSHRYIEADQKILKKPNLSKGSIMLWDFRSLHCGGANKSKVLRPLIYITYSRDWWRDCDNYEKLNQRRVNINSKSISRIKPNFRSLFKYCY